MSTHSQKKIKDIRSSKNIYKFIICSIIGVFMFFVAIEFKEKITIPLDHIVTGIKKGFPGFGFLYTVIIITLGGMYPFYKKNWDKDRVIMVFSLFKFVGIFIAFLALFGYGLLEFIGVLMKPVMRPIWKTTGRSAIDAVGSFVGSSSNISINMVWTK